MLHSFKNFIKEINSQQPFGVAVSGGIDSVVLCALCAQANLPFVVVHCNFGLRGEESKRDEAFVRSLAEKYRVEAIVKHFDTEQYAAGKRQSIQEAARALRYQWFTELHTEKKLGFVLLAHHANDNIETLLLNFFRGTGLDGLTGIPSIVPHAYCLRPLLQHTRKEIEAFAQQNGLEWVEDSSNKSSKYSRNFFRNEIIPAINKVYPQAEENLLNTIERFQRINSLYQIGVERVKKEVCEYKGEELHLPILKLIRYQHTSLIYELIKNYQFGEKQVDEVLKLLQSNSGKFIENETHQIIRHRNKLIIAPKAESAETIAIGEGIRAIQLADAKLTMRLIPVAHFSLSKSASLAQLDAALIEFPLLVRRWRQGDYFYPLGMRKKKKLARFFIDQKLSLADKGKIWVIESNKKIIWVVGQRIDDRFKISSSTKNVLEISISNL